MRHHSSHFWLCIKIKISNLPFFIQPNRVPHDKILNTLDVSYSVGPLEFISAVWSHRKITKVKQIKAEIKGYCYNCGIIIKPCLKKVENGYTSIK